MRNFKEFIPRNVIAMQQQDAGMMEQLTKNITRQGLTNYTLNFLRVNFYITILKKFIDIYIV